MLPWPTGGVNEQRDLDAAMSYDGGGGHDTVVVSRSELRTAVMPMETMG
jgi:hypothetical protein